MAATSLTRTYGRVLTTASDLLHKSGKIQDNYFQSNPLFHCLHGKEDGIRKEEIGGDRIRVGLRTGENTNWGSYAGADILDDSIQEGVTTAFYEWAQYSGCDTLLGINRFKNSGKAKIVDAWLDLKKQTMLTGQEGINKDLLDVANVTISTGTTGNGGKNLLSLPLLIQDVPSDTASIGAINPANEAWWRNRATDGAGITDTAILYNKMMSTYNNCSKGGGGAPDIVVADQVSYEKYVAHMDTKIRYEYTDSASVGFENVRFLGAKMFWDTYMPNVDSGSTVQNGGDGVTLTAGTMYFLNSNALHLYVGKGLDFAPQGVNPAERQDAMREYTLLYTQLVTDNRRKLGVLYDIDPAVVA